MFKPLSIKEEIQLQLGIVHDNTVRDDAKHREDIKVNVLKHWPGTLMFIDQCKKNEYK